MKFRLFLWDFFKPKTTYLRDGNLVISEFNFFRAFLKYFLLPYHHNSRKAFFDVLNYSKPWNYALFENCPYMVRARPPASPAAG